MLNSRRTACVLIACVCTFAAHSFGAEFASAHGDDTHEALATPPPVDELVLGDVMRLVAIDFELVLREGPKVGVSVEVKRKVVQATQNAQRYLRVVIKDWAIDDEFQTFADQAIAAWGRVEAAAVAGDASGIRDSLPTLGAACKACHETYRQD